MRTCHVTIRAALLAFECLVAPCGQAGAASDYVLLDGLSALSQLDPHNYRDIGLALDTTGGRHLIVLDPWPAPGEIMPKPEVRLDLASSPLRHPDIPGLVFDRMRRVSGSPFPFVAVETAEQAGTE